jgi:putative ABC transport system permease protein
MRALLLTFSWQELRHHPWRNAAAVLAVMLGVALAFSVHLINASALDEFSSAVRAVNGQPDLELRAAQGSFDESVYTRVATHAQVLLASPVLELSTLARTRSGERKPLRIVGVDALAVGGVAPALMPVPHAQADRMALFAPGQVFLNPAAQSLLGGAVVQLQSALAMRTAQVAGSISAGGAPLAVMDLGAAQELFDRQGELTRIDVKLKPGTDRAAFLRSLQSPSLTAAEPGDAAQRVSNLSRAYRVNLTVLALVALFTGAFLVYSVLSLGVAKRQQQFALLGVLGLSGRQRLQLVLAESLALGVAGSAAGIGLGTALAATALRLLGGDLGGGYFSGAVPALQWSGVAAFSYGMLGVAAAVMGGWLPARAMQELPPALALKGLGAKPRGRHSLAWSILAMAAAVLLALTPPVAGIPVAAYLAIGLLLVGGIGALPALIDSVYGALGPHVASRLLPLLAVQRARSASTGAAVAISGVVAALSLAVALTVMVASFRDSVTRWLDVVLPAELYVRTSAGTGVGDAAYFDAAFVQRVSQLPGVQRLATVRTRSLLLDPSRPAVILLARALEDPARILPLVGALWPVPAGHVGIYVSEAMVDLYGARPGTVFAPLAVALQSSGTTATKDVSPEFFVAGVWRDYVRQFGSIAMDQATYRQLTGDLRVNDIALWLQPGAQEEAVQQSVRALSELQPESGTAMVEFASASQLRATSLRIFDRSFAVTYWLQAVAIFIGLFGIAASFSAQVLARAKEFGLLAHLGLTRGQILTVVAGEGAAWTAIGALAGLGLGLSVSVVLVHVVNPQSFHWTMDLAVPWLRLAALCAAVVAAGTATAWLAGRAAAGRDAVLAVKEDW